MDITVSTRTVERKFVELGDDEYNAGRVLDFLEAIDDTDGFVSGVKCSGIDREIAEAFEEEGIVGHSYSAGFFVKDEEEVERIKEEIWDAYE